MTREQFISHVESTQRAFRRFLTALCCGDSKLADDVAQEAYIKAYLSCDDFNNAEKFNAWIFRIGYNTFLNHQRQQRLFCNVEEARTIAGDTSADGAFEYQELYRALDLLTDTERTSILLFYLEGYAVKEIAEIVGASQNAVKQHLSRGRNHLKNILENGRR